MSENDCVGDEGAGWLRIDGIYDDQGQDLAWELRGPGGSVQSGVNKWVADGDDWYPPLDFDLPIGHYRIVLTLADDRTPVGDAEFDKAGCVLVEPGCHELVLRNPAANPPARIRYEPSSDDWLPPLKGDGKGTVVLAPGETRSVDYRHFEVSGRAYAPADDPPRLSNAGLYQAEAVDQHCGPTMTVGVVRCTTAGRAVVDARFTAPDGRQPRFELYAWWSDRVRESGRVGADGRVRLVLEPGLYALLGYARGDPLPYDQAQLDVPSCVTAKARCHAVRFTNPTEETVEIRVRPSTGTPTTLDVKSGRSRTLAVPAGPLTWRVAASGSYEGWTIHPGRGSVRIADRCPQPNGPAADRLPNTGPPRSWIGPLGLLFTVLGLIVLIARRRRTAR